MELDFSYEVHFLLECGKLYLDWRNVYSHQKVELEASLVLGRLLKLPFDQQENFSRVAYIHDWKKRLEAKPQDFTENEREAIESEISLINPDKNLMNSTGIQFMIDVASGKQSTFLQRVQFYLDDICDGGEVVDLDTRIDRVSKRKRHLNDDEILTEKLNGFMYWDFERSYAHKVEIEVFNFLKNEGIDICFPGDIPKLINSMMQASSHD